MKVKLKNLLIGTKFQYNNETWILLNENGLSITAYELHACWPNRVPNFLNLLNKDFKLELRLPTIREVYKYEELIYDTDVPYYVALFDGPLLITDNMNEAKFNVPKEDISYGIRPVIEFDLETEVAVLDFDLAKSKNEVISKIDILIEKLIELRKEIGGN